MFGNTAGTLILDCPDGRPTSVTSVTVYAASSDDTSASEFTAIGTVESTPNTTTTAAAGVEESNPRRIPLTSMTGVTVGRRYFVVGSDGLSEQVEVASAVTGSLYCITRHPLVNQYVSGSTFHSRRVTAPVNATWVADASNISGASPSPAYRVRWVVVVGGVTRVYERGLDLGRYEVAHNVTPLDVDDAHHGFLDSLPPDHRADQGRRIIDRAWDAVRFELYGDDKAQRALRNPELAARLTIERVPLELLFDAIDSGEPVAESRIDGARNRFRQVYDQTIRSGTVAMDASGGGGSSPVPSLKLWSR